MVDAEADASDSRGGVGIQCQDVVAVIEAEAGSEDRKRCEIGVVRVMDDGGDVLLIASISREAEIKCFRKVEMMQRRRGHLFKVCVNCPKALSSLNGQ